MEIKNFYFRDRFGKWRLLAENVRQNGVWELISDFLDQHPNFQHYYTRYWSDKDGNIWYDVGSHTEFFIWGFEEE